MKVLVCGSREWTDREAIHRELSKYDAELVIHGAARGADSLAGEVAEELGMRVRACPAKWDVYGKQAGFIRNRAMMTLRPDVVLAFTPDLERSRGTRDMVRLARSAGIKTYVFNE